MLHAITITRSYCFPPSLLAHCLAFWHLYWRSRKDVSRHNRDHTETVDYLYLKSCFVLLYGPHTAPSRGLPSTLTRRWLSHSLIFSTMIKRTMSHIISSSETLSLKAFNRFNTSGGAWRNQSRRPCLPLNLNGLCLVGPGFCACPSTCGLALKKPSVSMSWALKDGIHME